ncbi:MAG TPA: HEAT repeat domain-containing protein [Streptosporangiaceae bacterium]|nr:HEAT repeat domain-containing protein [Streptosporangiaceae bacterium]
MISELGDAVLVLAGLECVLLAVIVVLRVLLRRNQRRVDQLRPSAELAIARYLATGATGAAVRPERRPAMRAIWRDVALEAMADLRGSERAALAQLLDDLGYVSEATVDLRSRRRPVRRRGAETLAAVANQRSLQALAAGLADRDVLVRMTCARALAEGSGTETKLPEIVSAVDRDVYAAPGAVGDIVVALGREHPEALDQLLASDAPAEVRSIAMAVIGELRLERHAGRLREILGERPADEHLAAAARALGMIGDIEAVPPLIALTEDESRAPATRAAAVTALGSIGDPCAVGSIAALVRHEDWALRTAAARALSGLGTMGRLALEQAAQSPVQPVREQAQAILQS